MKPYALTENRPLRINESYSEQSPNDAEQEEHQEIPYPRELSKPGLLVSLGITMVVVGLLIVGSA